VRDTTSSNSPPAPPSRLLQGAQEGVLCGLRSGAVVGGVAGFLLGLPFWWACAPLPMAGLGALAGLTLGMVAGSLGAAVGAAADSPLLGAALGAIGGAAGAGGPPFVAVEWSEARARVAVWERELQTRTSREGRAEAEAAIAGFRREVQEDRVFCALFGLAGAIVGGWAAASATWRVLRPGTSLGEAAS